MKIASDEHWYTWEQGDFIGSNKPHCRVVLSKQTLTTSNDLFRTQLFGNEWRNDEWFEIPTVNIQTLVRKHKVGTDAASMTLNLLNAQPISIGEDLDVGYDGGTSYPTKRDLHEQGAPGAYTYRRGLSSDGSGANPWGHVASDMTDAFLPNRIIWTFEGYGTDGSTLPWDDTKMVLTGTWLIDKVNIDAKGNMIVSCRDLAKLLIEQRLYPPIVPLENYPIEFCTDSERVDLVSKTVTTTVSTPEVVGGNVSKHPTRATTRSWDSSVAPWYGYNASVYGHRASHAFSSSETVNWISMRNSKPREDWSYEWLDADTKGETINQIRFRPWKGNYTLYVAVEENGKWQGSKRVPYNRHAKPAYPNGSDVNYIKKINMPDGENWFTIDLDRTYKADRVRLIFTNLRWFGRISGGDYRAGVYELQVQGYTPASVTKTSKEVEEEITTVIPGNIGDYTDIVKLFLAWSGFYWPDGEDDPLFLQEEWGSRGGRVWGDFFYSGAYPVEPPCIDASYWDNKSVMDAINQVKETLGFIGYVDNTGGFVWRPPNIWANGNYVTGVGWVGEASIPIVHENNLLMDYGVEIDDSALRSEIVVISSDDPTVYGSYSPGYAEGEESPRSIESAGGLFEGDETVVTDLSLLAGQQRVMLVPDYPFGNHQNDENAARKEVEKFAYLVALWIHWSYRKGKVKIPANPALDVDDQIRIYESKTSETYIHYILGMSTTLNMKTGQYTSDIETHWLGNGPEASWHMFVNDLPPALRAYLCQQGILTGAACGEDDSGLIPWVDVPPTIPDTPLPFPRIPSDLMVPYPRLPDVDAAPPIGDGIPAALSTTGQPISPSGKITDPGTAGGGSSTSGGSVSGTSNDFMRAYWPGTGPSKTSGRALTSAPASRRKLNYSGAGGYTVLDNRAWPAFQLLANIFHEVGVPISSASGKVHRKIRGSSQWSNHAWGTACDINAPALPWGKSIYSFSASKRDQYLSIANKASAIRGMDSNGNLVTVFYWGQGFSKRDPMHWQVKCRASDLSRGVWDIRFGRPSGMV